MAETEHRVGVNLVANAEKFVNAFNQGSKAVGTFNKALGKVGEIQQRAEAAMDSIGRKAAIKAAALGAGMAVNLKQAADFEAGMRNVNSILFQSEGQFKDTASQILKLSTKVPVSLSDLTEGLYDVASSGFDGAEGLEIMEQAAIGATAGMSTTAEAAYALTSAINAYGLSAASARDINDIFFMTVQEGVIEFDELSAGLGSWVGLASNAGVALDDASAALSAMTLSGIEAAEANTSLARVIQAFIKPSEAMTKTVREMGYANAETFLRTEGLYNAIQILLERTNGSTAALGQYFLEVRGLNGVLALAAANGENYANSQASIADESARAGSASAAYAEQSKSLNNTMKLFGNSLSRLSTEMGSTYIPVVNDVIDRTGLMVDRFINMPGWVKGGVAAIVALVAALYGLTAVVMLTALRTMLLSKILSVTSLGLKTWQVRILQASLGTKKFAAAQAWARIESSKFGQVISGVGQRIGGFGRAGKIAAGALAALLFIWTEFSAAAEEGRAEAQQLFDEAWQANTERGIEGLRNVQREIERTKSGGKYDIFPDFNWKSGSGIESFFKLRDLWGDRKAAEEMESNIEDLEKAQDRLGRSLERVGEATGLTRGEILQLAESASLNIQQLAFDAETGDEIYNSITAPLIQAHENLERTGDATLSYADTLNALHNPLSGLSEDFVELSDSQEELQKTLEEIGDPFTAFEEALADKERAVQDFIEAQQAFLDPNSEAYQAWDQFGQNVSLTMDEYKNALDAATIKAQAWSELMVEVGGRAAGAVEGSRDAVVSFFSEMGEEGLPLLEELAASGEQEFAAFVESIVKNTEETGPRAALEMDAAMAAVEAAAIEGGARTVAGLAEELGLGIGVVSSIVSQYGSAMAAGINPILQSIGQAPLNVGQRHPNEWGYNVGQGDTNDPRGGRYGLATGGMIENHVPTVATGGPVRVWNEPELPWEAYISGAGQYRDRSIQIWKETGRRLGELGPQGEQPQYFAPGGFTGPEDVPAPTNALLDWGEVGSKTHSGLIAVQERVKKWVEENLVPQLGAGIGWQAMWAVIQKQFPGAWKSSDLRPYDYDSWHGKGRAIDFGVGPSPGPGTLAAAHWVADNYGPQSLEVIHSPLGFGIKNGRRTAPYAVADHYDHIHWAMLMGAIMDFAGGRSMSFDEGGMLPAGRTMAVNNTGTPEPVFTEAQLEALVAGKGVTIENLHVHHEGDARQARRQALKTRSIIREIERADT